MKKHLFTAVLAIVAVGGTLILKAEPHKGSKAMSNQTVYYRANPSANCITPKLCSDNPARGLCTSASQPLYDVSGTCAPISDFQYLPE